MVGRDEVSSAVLETLDEKKKGNVFDWVNYILSSGVILQKDYVLKVSRLIKTIVLQESAIILGRGGNHILKGKPEGLRIKLTAPFDDRVSHISQIREMGLARAKELVLQNDHDRKEFIDNYFQGADKDLENFDLVFNTKSFSEKSICNITQFAMKEKGIN